MMTQTVGAQSLSSRRLRGSLSLGFLAVPAHGSSPLPSLRGERPPSCERARRRGASVGVR